MGTGICSHSACFVLAFRRDEGFVHAIFLRNRHFRCSQDGGLLTRALCDTSAQSRANRLSLSSCCCFFLCLCVCEFALAAAALTMFAIVSLKHNVQFDKLFQIRSQTRKKCKARHVAKLIQQRILSNVSDWNSATHSNWRHTNAIHSSPVVLSSARTFVCRR